MLRLSIMNRNQKAFTLIELLVVIAIIAILAAILFPVFAQAKAAAKKIASVSNAKEIDLSILMYSGDSDDILPPDTSWNTGSDPLCFGGAPNCFSTWAWLTAPYIKSSQILADPQVGGIAAYPFGSTNDEALTATAWPDYGYNYTFLDPWGTGYQHPVSDTSIERPADTVMLAAQGANTELQAPAPTIWGFNFTASADEPLLSETVEAPGCYYITENCAGGWTTAGFSKQATTLAAGKDTGGVSVRAGNQAVVTWLDGHTSALSPGALAVGTTWSPTLTTPEQLLPNWAQVNLWGGVK